MTGVQTCALPISLRGVRVIGKLSLVAAQPHLRRRERRLPLVAEAQQERRQEPVLRDHARSVTRRSGFAFVDTMQAGPKVRDRFEECDVGRFEALLHRD